MGLKNTLKGFIVFYLRKLSRALLCKSQKNILKLVVSTGFNAQAWKIMKNVLKMAGSGKMLTNDEIKSFYKINYNPSQNIWHKLKKYSKIVQDSIFACFLATIFNN